RRNANQCNQKCEVVAHFGNGWMHVFRLAPPTGIEATLRFDHGVLAEKIVVMGEDFRCAVYVNEGGPAAVLGSSLRRDGRGRPWKAMIHLSSNPSHDERLIAYGFNLKCLTKIGGCRDAAELLPSVWNSSSEDVTPSKSGHPPQSL